MITTDQLSRTFNLNSFPKRIISLVPSQTELLFDLGLSDEVIGITKFCIHPDEWYRTKTRIGGTKNLNLEKIKSLNPDLIIANKEENDEEQVNELVKDYPVWISDIQTLDDAIGMIREVSTIVNRKIEGENIINEICLTFENIKSIIEKKLSCIYLIWKNPYMTVGGDTFISEMLRYAGFKNIFANQNRYPEITMNELQNLKPEFILLSSEPYPFKEKDILVFKNDLPEAKILIVDGEMFSWYGSHLIKAPAYFLQLKELINSAS